MSSLNPTPAAEPGELRPAPLAGMLLATALAPFGSTMIAVALPRIGQDTGTDVAVLTPWLVTSYLIASIALQSPGGKLGDRIGHGQALLIGLALVTAGSLLGLVVDTPYALGVARVLTAAGGAATVPATIALLRNHTPPARRARRFGLFGACMGLAAAIGPLVGGELTERLGWRAVFAANLPVVAASLLLVCASRSLFRRVQATEPSPFDWLGSLLLAVGLTLLVTAVQAPAGTAGWVAAGGLTLFAVFLLWERRVASPVVDLSLLTRGAFFGGGAIVALQNMATYPLLFQLPVFFGQVRGLGARAMGQALLAMTLAMMLASIAAGRLAERAGARRQVLAASLVALSGLWWFTDFQALTGPGQILPGLVLLGLGVGLTSAPAQAAAMSAVGSAESGMAGGVLSTMRYLGGVAGTAALSALLVDPASPASHQRPILVYAGALVAAMLLAWTLPAGRAAARGEPPAHEDAALRAAVPGRR